jgi:hypothetical protein
MQLAAKQNTFLGSSPVSGGSEGIGGKRVEHSDLKLQMMRCDNPLLLPAFSDVPANDSANRASAPREDVSTRSFSLRDFTEKAFRRIDKWFSSLETRDREAFLARAQNIGDLEVRMRRLESVSSFQSNRAISSGDF